MGVQLKVLTPIAACVAALIVISSAAENNIDTLRRIGKLPNDNDDEASANDYLKEKQNFEDFGGGFAPSYAGDFEDADDISKRGRSTLFRFGKRASLFRFGKRDYAVHNAGPKRTLFRWGKRGGLEADEEQLAQRLRNYLAEKRGTMFRFGRSTGKAPHVPFRFGREDMIVM